MKLIIGKTAFNEFQIHIKILMRVSNETKLFKISNQSLTIFFNTINIKYVLAS